MASNNDTIKKILQSLDGTGKMPAPDFFYTRLKGRMEKEFLQQTKPFLLLRPLFLTACLLVLITFNIITLVNNKKHTAGADTGSANIEGFAKEYNMVSNELYQ